MPRSIRTLQGQAWDQAARKAYGSEKLMDRLIRSNAEEADVLLFSGNTLIELPDIEAREARRATVQAAPWERITGGA